MCSMSFSFCSHRISGSTLFKNVTIGAREDITVLKEIHLYSCDKKCTINGHFSCPSVHSICSYSYTNFKPLTHTLPITAGQYVLFIYHTGNRLLHWSDVLQEGIHFSEAFYEGLKNEREKPVFQRSPMTWKASLWHSSLLCKQWKRVVFSLVQGKNHNSNNECHNLQGCHETEMSSSSQLLQTFILEI